MRLVVLGDLHYTFYADPALTQGRELFYDGLFAEIAELQPDLVFSIGDAVNEGRVQEFEGLLELVKRRGLRNRFMIVTGNHDVLKTSKDIARFFLRPPASFFPDFNVPDTSYYAFDKDLARFIILDTAQEMNGTNWGGVVGPAQLEWLQAEVSHFNRTTEPQLLVVLAHHPLQNTTTRSEKPMMNILNSDEVWAILNQLERGSGLYFNGHNHVNSLAQRGRWNFVQAGALYRCGDYRLCEITAEGAKNKLKVKIQSKDVNSGSESTFELANRLGDAIEYYSRPAEAKGTSADRHLEIAFD